MMSVPDTVLLLGVYAVLVVIGNVVYRLSIITYSRNLIGCHYDRETSYMKPCVDIMNNYEVQHLDSLKYEDFSVDPQRFKDKLHKKYCFINKRSKVALKKIKMKFLKCDDNGRLENILPLTQCEN